MEPKDWRERIQIHPAAKLFPMLPDPELDQLADDLVQNGLGVSPAFFCPMKMQDKGWGRARDHVTILDWADQNKYRRQCDLFLLDGRNRLAAIERIADPEIREGLLWEALSCRNLHFDGDLLDPFAFVVSANLHRRHLSSAQKRELVAKLVTATPERSDRATAAIAKVSDKTVGVVRRELQSTAEIPQLAKTIGKDGKSRRQPRAAAQPESRKRDQTIVGLSTLLRQRPVEAQRDFIRILDDQMRQSSGDVALETRVDLARGYLRALRLEPDDLRAAV